MSRRLMFLRASVLWVAAAVAGCAQVNLRTAVEVTDVSSGYFDAGLTDAGLNRLVPSLTFTIKNVSSDPIASIDVVVFFWATDGEGKAEKELDELIVKAVGGTALAPAAATEPVVVRSSVGYTLQGARAELFSHGAFRDVTAKLFAKRGGRIVPIGEFPIERRLLLGGPSESTSR